MSAPGPAGARRIRRALLANGAPPNCKLLGVGPVAADFEPAEHRIAVFRSSTPAPDAATAPEKSRPSTNGKLACEYWSARTRQSAPLTLAADAFQSLGQFEMVAERSNWRFCLALGRTRLVGCWRSVDEVVAKLTAGELERGVPRGRGVFRDPNVGWALAIPCFPSATVNDQLINAT
jgi:hypothetical protein